IAGHLVARVGDVDTLSEGRCFLREHRCEQRLMDARAGYSRFPERSCRQPPGCPGHWPSTVDEEGEVPGGARAGTAGRSGRTAGTGHPCRALESCREVTDKTATSLGPTPREGDESLSELRVPLTRGLSQLWELDRVIWEGDTAFQHVVIA